jgi:hypothetical protein
MTAVLTAYKTGFKNIWSQKKLLFFLYGVNLFIAYFMSIPLMGMLEEALDHTTMANKLLQAFDMTALVTVLSEFGRGINLGWPVIIFSLIYLILSTFFSGGIVGLLTDRKNFILAEFMSDSAKYFGRFIRLLLIIIGLLLLVLILYSMLSFLGATMTRKAETEFWPFVLFIVNVTLIAVILAVINMLADYTKIYIVTHDSDKIVHSFRMSLLFVYRHIVKTSVLFGLLLLTVMVLLVLYLGFESLIPTQLVLGVALFFVVSQLFMFLKVGLRVWFYGGQIALFKSINT